MTYREKTLHWMRPDCWNPDGARLRFKQPTQSLTVSTDRRGNVTYVRPTVVGRPCFGIVTALVRYKDAMKPVKGKGLLPASRCAECKAREGCERLVNERVSAFAPLSTAYEEWLLAQGPSKFGMRDFEHTHVGRLWKRVGLAAADGPFTSANDAAAVEYYEKLDRDARLRDRRRQAVKRDRARRSGKIDSDHFADLDLAAFVRLGEVLEASLNPNAPRGLWRLPAKSIEDMCDVWLGREVLKAERKTCRAPDIARWIIANGRRNDSANFAALCTRVSKDLERIGRFERLIWNGAPLLRPFNPDEEYWSQFWLEADVLTPLETDEEVDDRTPLEIAAAVLAQRASSTPQG
jgi:hypothetical protein